MDIDLLKTLNYNVLAWRVNSIILYHERIIELTEARIQEAKMKGYVEIIPTLVAVIDTCNCAIKQVKLVFGEDDKII